MNKHRASFFHRTLIMANKELRLLSRDPHGLLLLFAMPCLFVLIMSFALQDVFGEDRAPIKFILIDEDQSKHSLELIEKLRIESVFSLRLTEAKDLALAKKLTEEDEVSFLVVIRKDYQSQLLEDMPGLQLNISPGTDAATTHLFQAFLREKLGRQLINTTLQARLELSPESPELAILQSDFHQALESHYLYSNNQQKEQRPSAVQQNVPAWLLFAMFFITIPLSATLIHERDQGTLLRLQSMGLRNIEILSSKLLPFFGINMLQVLSMLAVGVFLMPLLGAEQLQMPGSYAGLLLISAAASLAAVCLALLIANVSRTIEQATVAAGILNITMAAIGGIMVPRFIMPVRMQEFSQVSPMAWGLDGFLDILLRAGDVADVLPESSKLFAFAALCLTLAITINRYRAQE